MQDFWRFNPWRAPGNAPVYDPCGMAGGSTIPRFNAGEQVNRIRHGEHLWLRLPVVLQPSPLCNSTSMFSGWQHGALRNVGSKRAGNSEICWIACLVCGVLPCAICLGSTCVQRACGLTRYNTTIYAKQGDLGSKMLKPRSVIAKVSSLKCHR
jgi:hypothetical protein